MPLRSFLWLRNRISYSPVRNKSIFRNDELASSMIALLFCLFMLHHCCVWWLFGQLLAHLLVKALQLPLAEPNIGRADEHMVLATLADYPHIFFLLYHFFLSKNYLYSTGSSSQVRPRPISFLIVPLGTVMENPSRSSLGTQRFRNLPLCGLLLNINSVPSLSTASQTFVSADDSLWILSNHRIPSITAECAVASSNGFFLLLIVLFLINVPLMRHCSHKLLCQDVL